MADTGDCIFWTQRLRLPYGAGCALLSHVSTYEPIANSYFVTHDQSLHMTVGHSKWRCKHEGQASARDERSLSEKRCSVNFMQHSNNESPGVYIYIYI